MVSVSSKKSAIFGPFSQSIFLTLTWSQRRVHKIIRYFWSPLNWSVAVVHRDSIQPYTTIVCTIVYAGIDHALKDGMLYIVLLYSYTYLLTTARRKSDNNLKLDA